MKSDDWYFVRKISRDFMGVHYSKGFITQNPKEYKNKYYRVRKIKVK